MGGCRNSVSWHHRMRMRMFFFTFTCALSVLTASTETEARTIKYETFEEDAPGTVIGNLAKDLSVTLTMGGKANFRMMKQFNSSFIRLREYDGQLTIGERIDREKICKHQVQCLIAFDVVSFSKEQFKLVHVEVEVKDINDNSPQFSRRESTLEISENTAVGTRIPLDVAADEDVGTNYIASYQISVNSHFTIDVLSRADGVKYAELVLMKELDRETQASYALELTAADGGNPSRTGSTRVNVKVKDYNDNSPVFDRNNFSVDLPEDSPVGTLLLDLNAVDPDEGLNGEVVYAFGNQVSTEIRQLFKVDRKSGRLTLESPVDFESKKTYEFDVQARDLGPNPSPATVCKIVIQVQDVNDNAPEISITPMTSISGTAGSSIAYITEAAAKDSFVALVSTADRDSGSNGQVHCTLYGHEHFKLQQAYEDSYMVVTTAPLDRERIPEYNLTVVAEDLGSPPFRTVTQYTIRLSDENDNAPVFSKPVYEVSVAENNAPGAYITTVVARDSDLAHNGKVTYKLVDAYIMGSPVSTWVSLDPATGSLYALRSFNYEVIKQLDLRVQATDGGSPQQLHGSASISLRIVDQNDNAPTVTQPALHNGSAEVLLPRDAPQGYVITQITARDADEGANSDLSYRITDTEPKQASSFFSINKASGEIYLNHQLHYDLVAAGDTDALCVTVTVSDNGRPALTSTATIHLTVIAGAPPSDRAVYRNSGMGAEEAATWDLSIIIIVVLAGSCTLLLLAIILIATTCGKRKPPVKRGHVGHEFDLDKDGHGGGMLGAREGGRNNSGQLIPIHSSENVFEGGHAHPYANQTPFGGTLPAGSDTCSTSEDGTETTCTYESDSTRHQLGAKLEQGYSTLPGYGKETLRPITIWKGNSFTTISARDPQFSGKDSGKGDSDFNDSDSDISGDGLKKEQHQGNNAHNGLWACTSECKILGHSDRCWSPSATRHHNATSAHGQQHPHPHPPQHPPPHLSSFSSKTASLPRDASAAARRDNYYAAQHAAQAAQAQIPKTTGLQSVYEKVLHREFDYMLVNNSSSPARAAAATAGVPVQEMNDVTIPIPIPMATHHHHHDNTIPISMPVYSPTTTRCDSEDV